jgi:hypothetical protein
MMDGKAKSRRAAAMATPWRRRRMCILHFDHPAPAAIRTISARGAFLETNERPPLGSRARLHHPDAGMIEGEIRSLAPDGIELAFRCDAASIAFALAAIGADMTRP